MVPPSPRYDGYHRHGGFHPSLRAFGVHNGEGRGLLSPARLDSFRAMTWPDTSQTCSCPTTRPTGNKGNLRPSFARMRKKHPKVRTRPIPNKSRSSFPPAPKLSTLPLPTDRGPSFRIAPKVRERSQVVRDGAREVAPPEVQPLDRVHAAAAAQEGGDGAVDGVVVVEDDRHGHHAFLCPRRILRSFCCCRRRHCLRRESDARY